MAAATCGGTFQFSPQATPSLKIGVVLSKPPHPANNPTPSSHYVNAVRIRRQTRGDFLNNTLSSFLPLSLPQSPSFRIPCESLTFTWESARPVKMVGHYPIFKGVMAPIFKGHGDSRW